MISQREDDHITTGLEKLTETFKNQPVIEAMLRAFLRQADELEEQLWLLMWGWVLEYVHPDGTYNAYGKQLDDIGAIVGQLREGREDDDYVAALKIRIRINLSKGRSSDMVAIAALLDEDMTYVEYFPLAWEASLYNISNGGDISRMLAQAKAASSYGVILTSDFDEANVFKFDNAGADVHLFGSVTSDTPDVRFPQAIPTTPVYRRSS